MSGNDKNTNLYSASDIEKYLRGELSAPEMHQLERAALEDPFLADALEGMEIRRALQSPPAFQKDLDELQQRLDNRVARQDSTGGRSLFLPAWKVAAVFILLLGLGLTAYFYFLNRGGNSLAKVEMLERKIEARSSAAAADSIAGDTPAAASSSTVNRSDQPRQALAKTEGTVPGKLTHAPKTAQVEKTAAPEEQAATMAAKKQADPKEPDPASPPFGNEKAATLQAVRIPPGYKQQADSGFKKEQLQFQRDSLGEGYAALDKRPASAAPGGRSEMKEIYPKKNQSNPVRSRSFGAVPDQFEASGQFVFTGKVTDQNNHPLIGASLRLQNNYQVNAVTDKYGNFSLKLPKTDSSFKLTVAYVGFEQASLDLSNDNRSRTGNIIQLQRQSSSLNEVEVTGYGSKRKEILKDNSEPKKEFFTKKAAPADGWPAYKSYLEANKKKINPDSTLKGNETISFLVNKEGLLSSFRVEQSLSPAHDSASIHLIQQGPSWKLLKGKKARAYVIIPF